MAIQQIGGLSRAGRSPITVTGGSATRVVEDRCRICQSLSVRSFASRGATYLRCRDCEAITKALSYQPYRALNPGYDPGPDVHLHDDATIRHFLGIADKRRFLERYVEKTPRPCRLLDIGCGAGGYLLAARELGCDAIGVEPSASHATMGRALGLDIRPGYFDPESFDRGSFDVVILSHVIEHIYAPMEFLQSVMPLLRAGGMLVVVTPNAASLVARLSGPYWVMLKPIDHVSMLSERSLRRAGAEKLGDLEFRRTEYEWEVLASLLSAVRTAVRGDRDSIAAPVPTSKVVERSCGLWWDPELKFRRLALRVAGFPLHVVSTALDRQACLVMSVTKRACHVQ